MYTTRSYSQWERGQDTHGFGRDASCDQHREASGFTSSRKHDVDVSRHAALCQPEQRGESATPCVRDHYVLLLHTLDRHHRFCNQSTFLLSSTIRTPKSPPVRQNYLIV